MTWCYKNRGKEYHWIVDLYERLNLPVLPAVVRALKKATEERMAELEKRKTEEYKKNRISQKVARSEEQEERKKWGKRQAIEHSYGAEDDVDAENEDPKLVQEAQVILGDEIDGSILSGRKCKCGSLRHLRTSHRLCPLNKKNSNGE